MGGVLDRLLAGVRIPGFLKARLALDDTRVRDPARAVHEALREAGLGEKLSPGDRVCLAVGSRDISGLPAVVRAAAAFVLGCGARPFIVPAMGSHGGATAAGQLAVLTSLGVTRASSGAPVLATMAAEKIGATPSGLPVYLSPLALGADHLIPINRIKPHTDFRGPVGSGLSKMLAVGLGGQRGASACHGRGFERMAQTVLEVSREVVRAREAITALGLIENACHHLARVVALPGGRIHAEEPGLLLLADRLLARLPFEQADVLVLDEFGKDISGTGMDPNVTGRFGLLSPEAPFFASIAVRSVTAKSRGNCTGIGYADVITERAFRRFRFGATYPNAITAAEAGASKIPSVMPSDRLALRFALRMAEPRREEAGIRVVWLRNTLELSEFRVSEALAREAAGIPALEIPRRAPETPVFDACGNLRGFAARRRAAHAGENNS